MERLHAPLGRRALIEQPLEEAPANPRGALIWAQDDGELDTIAVVVPSGVFGKLEKQHCDLLGEGAECSYYVPEGEREARAMVDKPIKGERIAGFILITGIDGIRYAVRQHAVSVISDHDEAQDETSVLLHGGTVVRVPCSLDEVLAWFA